MSLDVRTAEHNAATLRRTIGDLNALLLPGDYDLQQAAMCTLAQLLRNAHEQLHHAKMLDAHRHD
jgi:hypothetical protein